jgi:hypothetical protein
VKLNEVTTLKGLRKTEEGSAFGWNRTLAAALSDVVGGAENLMGGARIRG